MRQHHDKQGRMGPRGGARREEVPSAEGAPGWFAGRVPDAWFEAAPEVVVDRDEILVVGRLTPPEVPEGAPDAAVAAAQAGRVQRFREETREHRMRLADEAEHLYGRKVAWGVQVGESRHVFTSLSVPVMTRLRQQDRLVLDTLVDAGVARSRSDALAWCVRLVGRNADSWLTELRAAMEAVERVREQGPGSEQQ